MNLPQVAGCRLSPKAFPAAEQNVNQLSTSPSVYILRAVTHHLCARVPDTDVVPLCILASSDSPRGTSGTKPFAAVSIASFLLKARMERV